MDCALSRDLYTKDYSHKILSNEVILTVENQTLKPSPLSAKKPKAPLKTIIDLINSTLNKNIIQTENPLFRQNFYNNIHAINQKIDRHNQRINTSLIVKILKIFTRIFCCRRFKEVHLDRLPLIHYSPKTLKLTERSSTNEKLVNKDLEAEHTETSSSPRNTSQLPPCGKIAILLKTGGLLGTEIPKELLEWRTPDDQSIPLDENELILTFILYDLADDVKYLLSSFSFYLPVKLFEDKKEGDVIELKRRINDKWLLLSFVIDQSTIYKRRYVSMENKKGKKRNKQEDTPFLFEDFLKTTCSQIQKDLEGGRLGFSKSFFGNKQSYEGYTSQHNAKLFVYNLNQDENLQNHLFIPQDIRLFRRKRPSFTEAKWSFSRAKKGADWKIVFAIPGITPQDRVDIVINEMYFSLYTQKPFEVPPDNETINQDYSNYNYLTIIPWKIFFEHLDQEQLMDQLSHSSVNLEDGLLKIQYSAS